MSSEIGGATIGFGALLLLGPIVLVGGLVLVAGGLVYAGAEMVIDEIVSNSEARKLEQAERVRARNEEAEAWMKQAQVRMKELQEQAARQGRQMDAQEQAEAAALSAITRSLTETSRQRSSLLQSFQQQTDALNTLLKEQREDAEKFEKQIRQAAVTSEEEVQQLLNKASRLNAQVSSSLSDSTRTLCGNITQELQTGTRQVAEQLQASLAELNKRLDAIADRQERQKTGQVYVQTLMQQSDAMYERLKQEYEAAAPQVQRSLSLRPLEDQRGQIGAMLQQEQGQAALVLAVNLMQQMQETTLKLDQATYQVALVEQQAAVQAELLKGLRDQTAFEMTQEFQDDRKNMPLEASYWCEAALAQQRRQAEELLARWENRQELSLTGMDQLAGQMQSCVAALNDTLAQGRQRMACTIAGWELMRNAVKAMQLTDWKATAFDFEREDDQQRRDYRSPMVTRFEKLGGSTLDLVMTPTLQEDGQWGIEIKMDRSDSGVVDEVLRNKQLRDIGEKLSKSLHHPIKLTCKHGTEGQNSPQAQNRYRLPRQRRKKRM